MDFERLKRDVLSGLRELPNQYRYHNVVHTLEVMENAARLGAEAGLNEHDQLLLNTAALMHDYGYLECYQDHECKGAATAETLLPQYGYAAEDVKAIAGMIRATVPPGHPSNRLECLICDADLGYLGSDRFAYRSCDLRQELMAVNKLLTDCEWYRLECDFLSRFEFKTPEGRKLFGKGLAENLEKVRKLLETCNDKKDKK